MFRRNPEKSGIIKFLKSPVFVLASAGLAWWTWDKDWAGAIPALAFMGAFYAGLWVAYSLFLYPGCAISENTEKGIKKSALLALPAAIGVLIFQWFYAAGAAFVFVGFVLILWKLPDYINRYFIVGPDKSCGGISPSGCRKWISAILCGLILFMLSPAVYYQYQYKQTVSRLSHAEDPIQLSAIHSLGEFALKHDAYYERVVQILAARVRELSPKEADKAGYSHQKALHILQLLGDMQKNQDKITLPINLRSTDISNVSLQDLDFRKVLFIDADLSGSCFFHSDLSGVDARHAVMHKAELRYMKANQADFFAVQAENADCRHSHFRKARFRWGSWKDTNFSASNMRHAVIRGRALKNVRLYRARMQHVNARGARFQNSNFRKARRDEGNFYRARFNGADLRGASLKKANLKEAVFVNADLRGADLTGALFEQTNFKGADLRGVKGLSNKARKKIVVNDKTRMED